MLKGKVLLKHQVCGSGFYRKRTSESRNPFNFQRRCKAPFVTCDLSSQQKL